MATAASVRLDGYKNRSWCINDRERWHNQSGYNAKIVNQKERTTIQNTGEIPVKRPDRLV